MFTLYSIIYATVNITREKAFQDCDDTSIHRCPLSPRCDVFGHFHEAGLLTPSQPRRVMSQAKYATASKNQYLSSPDICEYPNRWLYDIGHDQADLNIREVKVASDQ